jgi:glycosyltransferase involved in cell wall biosynthesis
VVNIRVAYDISFLGKFFKRPDEQSGVYRVIEELFEALSDRPDLCLVPTAVSGEDPLKDSINARLYLKHNASQLGAGYRHSFRSRLKLDRWYGAVFEAFGSGEAANLSSYSPRGIWLRGSRSLLYRLAYKYKLDRLQPGLEPDQFDVFHSPFGKLPSPQLTGQRPRVLTIYDLIFLQQPQFMTDEINAFMQEVFDSLDVERDWFTAISQFTKNEFCDYTGAAPERVQVAPLAAAEHFQPIDDAAEIAAARSRYGIPEGDYLLSLAAIQPRKNLPHLIRCFGRLLAEHPSLDLNLVLVGKPSWIFDEVFATAEAESFRRRMTFTGYVPDHDLSAIYSGATAFVFPSLYEGFGLPPLEAMQSGVPVITSNDTAFPEVVGDAGLLVDPTNENDLCQAILDVVSNDELRLKLKAKGLARARQFSWANCAAETTALYRKAMCGSV